MNRSFMAAVAVVTLSAACIEANRPQFVPRDGSVPDTSVGETTVAPDTSVEPDTDSECDASRPCAQIDQCTFVACEAGRCVASPRDDDDGCDDGNACTGPDVCRGGHCAPGPAVLENSVCDDDQLYCNGYGLCHGGACDPQFPAECDQSVTGICTRGSECSEVLHGGCAPKPVEDGEDCELGEREGACSSGVCVPAGMVWIAASELMQGCEGDNLAICPLEAQPRHKVRLSGYAIDAFELDEGMWRRCVTAGKCTPRIDEDAHALLDDNVAATGLDYVAAGAACKFHGRRLCTEAQWENAAHGPFDDYKFPWGNLPADCDHANFKPTGSQAGCGSNQVDAVGLRPAGASPFGVLDMSGNVWEWTFDGYRPYSQLGPGPLDDPAPDLNPDESQNRVLRGGGWRTSLTRELYTYFRRSETANTTDVDVGGRCCWVPADGGFDN